MKVLVLLIFLHLSLDYYLISMYPSQYAPCAKMVITCQNYIEFRNKQQAWQIRKRGAQQ